MKWLVKAQWLSLDNKYNSSQAEWLKVKTSPRRNMSDDLEAPYGKLYHGKDDAAIALCLENPPISMLVRVESL